MESIVNEIQAESPKALKYFFLFYEESDFKLENVAFETLPFEFQLGCFIRFFDTINSDIQLYATDSEVLKECVLEAFATYEEYLFLDS